MPRKPVTGVDDLATLHTAIAIQWHTVLNGDFNPKDFLPGSKFLAFWVDEFGHVWKARVQSRVGGQGCPFCAGVKVLAGFNDLATTFPAIAAEWDTGKNSVDVISVSSGSTVKAWWKCVKGHEWEATVNSRTSSKQQQCRVCSKRLIVKNETDLATRFPALIAEWHPTRNAAGLLDILGSSSQRKVWWIGECEHEWFARVDHRVNGSGCPVCLKRPPYVKQLPVSSNLLLATQWNVEKNKTLNPNEITLGSELKVWWKCELEHEWFTAVYNRNAGKGCPACSLSAPTSQAERIIVKHFESLNVKVEANVRNVMNNNLELDVYFPDAKLAVEFNGLYWHTEDKGKTKWYHYNKWEACKEVGVQLVQIWEDDWVRNPETILHMLEVKVGVHSGLTVFGRKTFVSIVNISEAQKFLTTNHIQGFASGSYYLGLRNKTDDSLVAIIVLRKESGTEGKTLNIIRYATNCNVPGGFTKLLKHAELNYSPEKIITFSDHTVSNGGLYENNGFTADKELAPDYMYVFNRIRKHKFGYRLKRFRNDPELNYIEGYTESQLAKLNNLSRIWDAGKTRWVKTF